MLEEKSKKIMTWAFVTLIALIGLARFGIPGDNLIFAGITITTGIVLAIEYGILSMVKNRNIRGTEPLKMVVGIVSLVIILAGIGSLPYFDFVDSIPFLTTISGGSILLGSMLVAMETFTKAH